MRCGEDVGKGGAFANEFWLINYLDMRRIPIRLAYLCECLAPNRILSSMPGIPACGEWLRAVMRNLVDIGLQNIDKCSVVAETTAKCHDYSMAVS